MAIRIKSLVSSEAYLFVATWNGSNSNTATGLKVSSLLKQVVITQIGAQAAALFESDFVNYSSGYILCQNVPDNLNIIYTATNGNAPNNLRKTLRFTVVRMPSTFIGQKGNLSKNYEYGERLRVSVSLERLADNDKGKQTPTIDGSAVQRSVGPIRGKTGVGVNYMIYRDANLAARTLKSQSGGGGGIGVWS